jgi:uncharacterized membrane protein
LKLTKCKLKLIDEILKAYCFWYNRIYGSTSATGFIQGMLLMFVIYCSIEISFIVSNMLHPYVKKPLLIGTKISVLIFTSVLIIAGLLVEVRINKLRAKKEWILPKKIKSSYVVINIFTLLIIATYILLFSFYTTH